MKIKSIFVFVIYLLSFKMQAQVGIGTTNPDASSILDITSTDKGVLVPRVNLIDVTNATSPIATPATGLLVWNNNVAVTGGNGVGFYFFNGTQWQSITGVQKIDDLIDGKSDSDGTQDGSSVFLGLGSGFNDDSSDNQNVGVGSYSLFSNSTGYQNVAIGRGTLINNVTGYLNTAVGYASMNLNPTNGRYNTALGAFTLNFLVNAQYNTAIGYRTLYSNNGGYNTAVGNESMLSTTTGGFNTAMGNQSLYSNTTGVRNTAIGSRSLYSISVGSDNVAIGYNAGYFETGSNKLYIENSNSTTPLIYGEFDTNLLRVNGTLDINNVYQFPSTDGASNQVMQTDGAGNISWVDATSLGTGDHDFYEEGTTTAPDDINDDQFTMGNLAIGKNTADYPLDIESSNGGRGVSILMNGVTNNPHYGEFIRLEGNGTGTHYGTQNTLSGTGNGIQYGVHNIINNTGTEIHYGTYNTLTGTGTGRQYGVYNEIDNSGNANHFGSYSALTGTGSGSHYGNWVRLEGAGTGNQIGAYNFINNSGDGDHYGSYNVLSGTGSGPHYGNWARLFGAGTGQQYGNYTLISNSGNATHYGDFTRLDGSGSGTHYGNWVRLHGTGTGFQVGNNINIDNSGNNNHWGEFIVLSGSGSGVHYGSEVILSGLGIGDQIGYRAAISNSGNGDHIALDNNFSGTGNGPQYGVKNYFSNNGASNPQYGSYNEIYSQGDGLHYGLYSTISNSGNGNKYGVFSQINGSGSGAKYGTYNIISSSSGGTHYGVYSNVLKAGSYAGYFLGNVSIGTTAGNNYILPASRGTNGQIMQTDGTGNVSWVNIPSVSYWSRTGNTLDVATAADDISFTSDQTSIIFPNTNSTPSSMIYMFQGSGNVDRMVLSHSPAFPAWGLEYEDATDSFIFKSSTQERVEIDLAGGYPLRVYGTARAVNFESNTTTYPDYVFESYYKGESQINKDYSFKTLAEVEAFIKKNGHLPNVKSYQEVKDKGMTIDVGEMTVTNLEKIEEAYLYIIELKKENEALKNKLASQEKEINKIKALLKM